MLDVLDQFKKGAIDRAELDSLASSIRKPSETDVDEIRNKYTPNLAKDETKQGQLLFSVLAENQNLEENN